MKHHVKPLVKTILETPEIQDCALRSCTILESSPEGATPFVKLMIEGISNDITAIKEAEHESHKSISTLSESKADTHRNRRFMVFKNQAMDVEYTADENSLIYDANAKVVAIMIKHNAELYKIGMEQKSVALKGLFSELDLPENQKLLEVAQLMSSYVKLKRAQAQFETIPDSKDNSEVLLEKPAETSEFEGDIIYRLNALYTHLDAWAVDQYEKHKETVRAINEVIDSVMVPARARVKEQ